jgi:hypothetical protein
METVYWRLWIYCSLSTGGCEYTEDCPLVAVHIRWTVDWWLCILYTEDCPLVAVLILYSKLSTGGLLWTVYWCQWLFCWLSTGGCVYSVDCRLVAVQTLDCSLVAVHNTYTADCPLVAVHMQWSVHVGCDYTVGCSLVARHVQWTVDWWLFLYCRRFTGGCAYTIDCPCGCAYIYYRLSTDDCA